MIPRRTIRRSISCLLLGASLAVLTTVWLAISPQRVAWLDPYVISAQLGLTGNGPGWQDGRWVIHDGRVSFFVYVPHRRLGRTEHIAGVVQRAEDAPRDPDAGYVEGVPGWLRRHTTREELTHPIDDIQIVRVQESGWPMRAASSAMVSTFSGNATVLRDGIPGDPLRASVLQGRDPIPTAIVWPGFLANAVVYAIPLLVIWELCALSVRMRRRSRGLCASCGYDLSDQAEPSAVCPECGARPANLKRTRRRPA